jgi:CRISPR-associated endoribonuclease Cas6
MPTDPEFPVYLTGNLRRKAETLGLDPEVALERITWIGTKRSFAVGDGMKTGAAVEVELRAAPETLQAVWSWGLGQANSAGFGWVAA